MKKIVPFLCLWVALCGFALNPFGCSSSKKDVVVFTPVGASFGTANLIDLEFLPGTDGEAVVIAKDGTVFYMTKDFAPLAQTVTVGVLDEDEQGLLNVVADPGYADNHFIYLYGTLPTGDGNHLGRYTVAVDISAGTFDLTDPQAVEIFSKTASPDFDGHHNGGGLVFGSDGALYLGVGDGGGAGGPDTILALAQDGTNPLGKIHRILPNRNPGEGGALVSEIHGRGFRNPFTLAVGPAGLFVGDVGSTRVEEVDLLPEPGLNFGWPITEGPSSLFTYVNPVHSYEHTDNKFAKEDPTESDFDVIEGDADETSNPQSVIVGAFYEGGQYDGKLDGRLIYSDFFQGWVRGFKLKEGDEGLTIDDDKHLGHLNGLTSLQKGPDGFLYAISLFGSDHVLRVDLAGH
ncbi:MAG TPA: PQQ-dependent sugar dehydrogenase [bacterium]|nr:PQQ-dependent sugar dehydrogenase [bacterium]